MGVASGTCRGTVIVVDDHDDLRLALTDLFTAADYAVLQAANGHVALGLARTVAERAVLILDLAMPEGNGWELIELVKQEPALQWLPMVVITAFPRKSPPGLVVFSKPFDPQELLVTVARLVH